MEGEVTVVGAGVVGLSLARMLAERGISVSVYDSKRNVADGAEKASGIFSVSGLRRIGIPYDDAVINRLNGARLHAGGEILNIMADDTKAYVVDRGKLAEACLKGAREAGANIHLNKRLSGDDLHDMARGKDSIVVGADGAVSTVASTFGFPSIPSYVLTAKATYRKVDVHDASVVDMHFDNSVTEGFFGWLVPYSRDTLEVAVGISSTAKIPSTEAFRKFLASDAVTDVVKNGDMGKELASIIPLKSRDITVKGNVALVGDAAGQVKATTGGGIIFGVSCAEALTDAISATLSQGKRLGAYEKLWRGRHGKDLWLHGMLHGFYSGLGHDDFARLFRILRFLGAESFLGRYGDMDRLSLIVKRLLIRRASD